MSRNRASKRQRHVGPSYFITHISRFHWSVSEGAIEIDENLEEQNEALKAEIENYKDKITKFRQEDPGAFEREKQMQEYYQKGDVKWTDTETGYPKIEPYYGKRAKFNVDYVFDMYKAAQKDKRKQELKDKYFSDKSS